MKFLKEIITRKHTDDGSVNVDDMAAMLNDAEAEESSNAEMFNNLAAIQSRIKGTQSDSSELKQEDSGSVKDFSELVEDIREDEDEVVAQPSEQMMTEEDYINLDNELARMSEELEEEEAEDTPDIHREPRQRGVIRGNRVSNASEVPAAAVPIPALAQTAKVERPSAFGNAVRTPRPPAQTPGTISISEAQGGGANFDEDQVKEVKAMAVPKPAEIEIPKQAAPEITQPEQEKPALKAAIAPVPSKPQAPPQAPSIVEVPAPAAGRSGRRAGRVKTRLLGFEHANGTSTDPFSEEKEVAASTHVDFPVGWIVVVEGPGRGAAFSLMSGVSQIGRGDDQAIKLDFGDTSISRLNHAAIAYDNEQNSFYLGHGGKANLVRLNDKPVLSTEEINDSDLIRIGETTLRFVALCGGEFNWSEDKKEASDNAANA